MYIKGGPEIVHISCGVLLEQVFQYMRGVCY